MKTIKAILLTTCMCSCFVGCSQRADNLRTHKTHNNNAVTTADAAIGSSDSTMPSWAEVPAWAADESACNDSEFKQDVPTALVKSKLIVWYGDDVIHPAILPNRQAVLSAAAVDHITKAVQSRKTSSILISPRMMVADGRSAHVAMFASGEEHESGVVFFVEPRAINSEGAELYYSFQCGNEYSEESNTNDRRFTTRRLMGAANLDLGQWLVSRFEDGPNEMKRALFIQIERVDFPNSGKDSLGG